MNLLAGRYETDFCFSMFGTEGNSFKIQNLKLIKISSM